MDAKPEVSSWSRRRFMKTALGGGAVVMLGQFDVFRFAMAQTGGQKGLQMILVDYAKCTGCRTCETACSAFNHPVTMDEETLKGLGNPYLANIQVYPYNPDVDIPAVCAMCPDTPCISACPVAPDPATGSRALYREAKHQTITNDPERCISCGSCAEACRVGIIRQNGETDRPEQMCTLCVGDPQCVKQCPYGALSLVTVETDGQFYGLQPDQIAEELIHQWYGTPG
jgi:Fe-S-cluster-containing hydrogenase component 2